MARRNSTAPIPTNPKRPETNMTSTPAWAARAPDRFFSACRKKAVYESGGYNASKGRPRPKMNSEHGAGVAYSIGGIVNGQHRLAALPQIDAAARSKAPNLKLVSPKMMLSHGKYLATGDRSSCGCR